jgi:hypothetical protein
MNWRFACVTVSIPTISASTRWLLAVSKAGPISSGLRTSRSGDDRAAVSPGVAPAHAGPCTAAIAQAEQAVRQSTDNPHAGPMAPSIGAELDRQMPGLVKRAEERAQATFAATLARAKRLDARGDRAGCTRALAAAKRMYNF